MEFTNEQLSGATKGNFKNYKYMYFTIFIQLHLKNLSCVIIASHNTYDLCLFSFSDVFSGSVSQTEEIIEKHNKVMDKLDKKQKVRKLKNMHLQVYILLFVYKQTNYFLFHDN